MDRQEMEDFDSTLIRRGRTAVRFSDMVEFAQDVHRRPLEKLLEELPQLARLSDSKFSLAAKILRQRFRIADPVEQQKLREIGDTIASGNTDWVASRIRSIFRFDAT